MNATTILAPPPTWQTAKLGQLVSFKTGKLNSNAATPNGAYPFFTCSQETLKTDTYSFDTECVLLAGNNANGIYPIKYYFGKFDVYQRTYVIRPLDCTTLSTRYLYFALQPKLGLLKSISTGAATKFLTLTILNDLEVNLPPIGIQRRIATILSAYDDLIANNTRRIAILEEMARALYREWFVNFRFPDHEQVPLVESELRPIPEGWEVKNLADVAMVNASSIQKGQEPRDINYIDIASVSTGRINNIEQIAFAEAPGRARRKVTHGDIIWSTVRPNRKSYALILDPIPNLIVSTGFAVVTPTSVPYTYLYQALTTDDFADYLTNAATGSAYPAVNAEDFRQADLVVPPCSLLAKFHRVAAPIFQQAQLLQAKNTNLRQTRDLLLPKLVSGELAMADLAMSAQDGEP